MYDELDDIIILEEGKVTDNLFWNKQDKMTDAEIEALVKNTKFLDRKYWEKQSIEKLEKERDKCSAELAKIEEGIRRYDDAGFVSKTLKNCYSIFFNGFCGITSKNIQGRISLQQYRFLFRRNEAYFNDLIKEKKEADKKKPVKESFDVFRFNL